jgi:hypothetical protein
MKQKNYAVLVILCVLGMSLPVWTQSSDEKEVTKGKKYPVNLSLFYPVSINQSPNDVVNFNLTLIYSRVGYVYGLDLSAVGSAVEQHLEGIQLCGLAGVVGESAQGVQVAGLACIAGDSFTGLQVAGLASVTGESHTGLQVSGLANVVGNTGSFGQVSGLANVAGEGFTGFQISGGFNIGGGPSRGFQAVGLFNVVGEGFRGIQASGLFNVVGENFEGAQLAGLFNITGEDMRGLQVGTFNIAPRQRGVQIGVANVAANNTGLQIGLVNYTREENNGVPIGAVNIAPNGRIRGIAWLGNGVAVSGGAKFTVGPYYSIVSLGAYNTADDIGQSLTYGVHYGLTFPVGRMSLNPDVGYRFRDNTPLFRNPQGDPDQHILEGRLTLGIPVSPRLSLMVGTGLAHRFNAGSPVDSGDTYPLIFAGVEFF